MNDSAKLAEYVETTAPVLAARGAKFIVRGTPTEVYEAGLPERTVDARCLASSALAYVTHLIVRMHGDSLQRAEFTYVSGRHDGGRSAESRD